MRISLFLLVLLISGCATPEQRAARQAAEQERFRQGEAEYNRQLRAQCESVGYKPDTDPWRNCLIQLHTANQQRDAALRAAILQGIASQPQQQPYRPPQPRVPVQTNCNRDAWGNVSCTSY